MNSGIAGAAKAFGRFLSRNYVILYSACLFVMIVFGFFGNEDSRLIDLSIWRLALLLIAAVLLLAKLFLFFRLRMKSTFRTFELGMICVATLNVIVQASGGLSGELYPINYILVSLITAFSTIPLGLVFAGLLAVVEAGRLIYIDAGGEEMVRVLYHLFFTILFCLGIGVFLKMERENAIRAKAVLAKLSNDADDLAQRAGTHKDLASLKRSERNRSTVRNVFSLDEELFTVLEIARKVFGSYSAVLLLLDGDGKHLRVRMQVSDSDNVCDVEQIKLTSTVLNWVLKHNTHFAIPEVKDSDQLGYYKRSERIQSALAAPVIGGEDPIGVLVVDSEESESYDRQDGRVLSRFAQLLAQSINRAKDAAELESARVEFAALFSVSEKLSSSLELSDIGGIILESARSIVDSDAAMVVLIDDQVSEARIEAVKGPQVNFLKERRFDARSGLVGSSILQKKYWYLPNFKDWEKSLGRKRKPILTKGLDVRDVGSLLCLPLVHKDKGMGALILTWKQRRYLSDFEQKILRVFVDMCSQALANARMYLQMEQMATTDGLTGLTNHRVFQDVLLREIERAERMPANISLIMVDIDHFKNINDTYGHPIGDEVLRQLAKLLHDSVRSIDMAARYGGEEFALVLINTDERGALKFSERLRKSAASMKIPADGETIQITVSLGLASYPRDTRNKDELIELADTALYHSKENGRNRVTYVGSIPRDKR